MKKERILEIFLNGGVLIVLLLAMYLKYTSDRHYERKPYGELQATTQTLNVIAAATNQSSQTNAIQSVSPSESNDDLFMLENIVNLTK
jgi:hypothetical protein